MAATGLANQRCAAGWTESVIQRSSAETMGQASVAGGVTEAVATSAGAPGRPSGTARAGARSPGRAGSGGSEIGASGGPPRRPRAGRAQRRGETQKRAFPQRGDLERIVGPAHAGPLDRPQHGDPRPFLHRAGFEALRLGLAPPRLALGEPSPAAGQRDEDEAADETPTNLAHSAKMRGALLMALQ